MKKQIIVSIGISLFCCFSVLGGESESTLQAGVNSLDNIACVIDENGTENGSENGTKNGNGSENENENGSKNENGNGTENGNESEKTSSSLLLQEIQSIEVGQSSESLEEEAKKLAQEENVQQKLPGNRWGIFLTPSEIDLLARIVMLEAGGESALGQQAVTEVILNRMVSPYYGGSLEHVLSARGQFTTWKMRYSAQAAPTPQVIANIMAVLQGETNILPFQTLYFSRKPQNRRMQIRIGGHTFCNQY